MTDRYGQAKETVHRVAEEARREYEEFKSRAQDVVKTAKSAYETATGVTGGKALNKVISRVGK